MGSLVERVYEGLCVAERNDDSLDKKAKRSCGIELHQKVESPGIGGSVGGEDTASRLW